MQYILTQKEYDDISEVYEKRIKELTEKLEKVRKVKVELTTELGLMEHFTHVNLDSGPSVDDLFAKKRRVSLQYDFENIPKSLQAKINVHIASGSTRLPGYPY